MTEHSPPATIAIIAFDNSIEMSISLARDLFFAASEAAHKRLAVAKSNIVTVSQSGQEVTVFNGSRYAVDQAIKDVQHCDLVIVSGVWGDIEPMLAQNQETLQWLKQQHKQGATIAAMSSGAFLLAEAGLLDGKTATIYWRMEDSFQQRYPKVVLQNEKAITGSDRLYCSSGIGSGTELAVFLIEKLWGLAIAETVSRNFLMDIPAVSRDYMLSLSSYQQHNDDAIHQAQRWLESNFSTEFLMCELAEKYNMSLRSFMRRFKLASGITGLAYVQKVRMENAKHLLTAAKLSVDEIAYRVGYQDAGFFNRVFKREVGQTPGDFKKAVVSIGLGAVSFNVEG